MSPEERQALKEIIKNRIIDLKKNIESLEEMTKPISPDRAIGRVARMDAIHSQSILEANLFSSRDSLVKIEEALKKIDTPEFGNCAWCKQPIAFERIKALPETNKCIRCA